MTRLWFNEVVTRDGFQNERAFIDTEDKVALIDALSACGYATIEVTSFTSAKAIPMLRDAEAVMARIWRAPGVEYTVLVPNRRGAERAMAARSDELNLVMSVSQTHNRCNLRMSCEASFAALAEVLRWTQACADLGVRGLTLCDTTGMAHPAQVARVVEAVQRRHADLHPVPDDNPVREAVAP